MPICSVADCLRTLPEPGGARGLCRKHYQRWRSTGDPTGSTALSLEKRFFKRVSVGPASALGKPCLLYSNTDSHGYGQIMVDGKELRAHRVVLQLAGKTLDPDLDVDHLCHNVDWSCPGGPTCLHRACVEITHLESASRKLNIQRRQERVTHCINDHVFNEVNTYMWRGGRHCRICRANARAGLRSS